MKYIIKSFLLVVLSIISLSSIAQNKLISLDTLINKTDPAWPLVKKWVEAAKK